MRISRTKDSREFWRLLFVFALLAVLVFKYNDSCLSAQSPDIDSPLIIIPEAIWHDLEGITSIRGKVDYLLTIVEAEHTLKPQLSIMLAEHVESLTKGTIYTTFYAKALYWKAFISNKEYPQDIKLQRALADVKISIDLLEAEAPSIWLARALNLRAMIHYNLYEEKIGEQYNRQAQSVLSELNKTGKKYCNEWGDLYKTEGNILFYTSGILDSILHQYDLAKSCYEECKDTNRLARLLMNYAIVYEEETNYHIADSLMISAIKLYEHYGKENQIANAYLDYATFHANRFKSSKATEWFLSSNKLLHKILLLQPGNISEVYYQLGANHHNYAIYSDNMYYDSAAYYYELAIDTGLTEGNAWPVQKAEEQIAKICPDIGPDICSDLLTKSAIANQEMAHQTRLSFRDAARKREAFQDSEARKKQRWLINTIFYSALSLIVIGLFLYQKSKVNILQKQLKNRMEALRSQMNPHFISNTLNAIDSLVNKGEKEKASEYIIDFSRLSRLILNNSKTNLISLSRELETLGFYLSLEKLRMGNRLHYNIEVDDFLMMDKIQIPPMLLQPFVENAIVHGIQNKQASGNIWIFIRQKTEKQLEIRIKDNGVGRKKAKELRAKSVLERPSWGVSITKERLETMKKIKEVNIEYIDLFDEKGEGCGTEVIIQFPIIHKA